MINQGTRAKREGIVMFGSTIPPGIMLTFGWKTFTREDLLRTPHQFALMFGHPETGQNGMRRRREALITGVKIVTAMIQGDSQSHFSLLSL